MDQPEFERVALSFATFHAEFAPLFGRKEAQHSYAQRYHPLQAATETRRPYPHRKVQAAST
jgi:hypothetical protein